MSVQPHSTPPQTPGQAQGPKFAVNIEGDVHDWAQSTISTEDIIELGGWDPALGAIEVDLQTNTTRTLAPGETVELKPGQGFAKKIKWKRGGEQ